MLVNKWWVTGRRFKDSEAMMMLLSSPKTQIRKGDDEQGESNQEERGKPHMSLVYS
jgi:hypothetical protein